MQKQYRKTHPSPLYVRCIWISSFRFPISSTVSLRLKIELLHKYYPGSTFYKSTPSSRNPDTTDTLIPLCVITKSLGFTSLGINQALKVSQQPGSYRCELMTMDKNPGSCKRATLWNREISRYTFCLHAKEIQLPRYNK